MASFTELQGSKIKMTAVTPLRILILALVAVSIFLGGMLAHRGITKPVATPATPATVIGNTAPRNENGDDTLPTEVNAHNLLLRKGPDFRIYIRWIRGQMVRTHKQFVPSFDDPESFVFEIQKGVIRVNIGDISHYLNAMSPKNAPLTNIQIEPAGDLLKLHGTVHKILPIPVEIIGQLSPAPNGQVLFTVSKINMLKIPLRGLLKSLHIELSDLVNASGAPGVAIEGNNILFDTQRLLPPPHIHGRLTSIRVRIPDLEAIYGNAGDDETKLSQWHNFLNLRGGTLKFGKLTMDHVDLTMIDASQDPWFDLDLVNYQSQLVNGYTRMTAQAGLEIYMPDLDEEVVKKSARQKITLEWLKNRNLSPPPDVPVR